MKITKKKVLLTLFMGTLLTAGLAFTACGEKAHVHTPAEDDGDCTTAVLCTECEQVVVAAKDSHTPSEDDGDCTTAVLCTECEQVAIAARATHTDDDVDGTCDYCTYTADYYYDESTQTYTVFTADGLYAWAEDETENFSVKNLIIGKDIVMPTEMHIDLNQDGEAESNWKSVYKVTGTIDGNGHSITGLTMKNASNSAFIYEITETGVLKNLRLNDVVVEGSGVSGIVDSNSGRIENCSVSGSVKDSGDSWSAGIANVNWAAGTVIACYNEVAVVGQSGGVVGQNHGSVIACYNIGTLTQTNVDTYGPSVGGVVGANFGGSMLGCYSVAGLSATGKDANVGGIVGYTTGTIHSCYWDTPEENPTQGNGRDDADPNTLRVDGETITWNSALQSMNRALENYGCDWRYALNGGAEESVRPLVLIKITA